MHTRRPQVVIIGGGFGGMTAARELRRAPVDVTLIDRTNHHLFQPLLYQVATATLAPSDISVPIRWRLREQKNTRVLLGDVREIDTANRVVHYDDERRALPYDYLVVAAGARHSYFGNDAWEPIAPGLKNLDDALEIRRRFLLAFENAEKTDDPRERDALLTMVIVGGGPTGVELAGLIVDIARNSFNADFRRIDTRRTRVILLEGGDRLLPSFPDASSARTARDLRDLGVEVRTGAIVTRVEPDAVWIGEERIETRTVLWAAGNAGSPLARTLGVPLDRAGRVLVRADLSVEGRPEVFVVGDLAAVQMPDGTQVPGTAPAANQQGMAAARNILHSVRGTERRAFRFRDKGNMATIGRHRAVAVLPGGVRLSGIPAWLAWLFVHIMYLAGFRNRLSVLLQWAYAYWTYHRGVRLIVGGRAAPSTAAGAAGTSSRSDERGGPSPARPIRPIPQERIVATTREQAVAERTARLAGGG